MARNLGGRPTGMHRRRRSQAALEAEPLAAASRWTTHWTAQGNEPCRHSRLHSLVQKRDELDGVFGAPQPQPRHVACGGGVRGAGTSSASEVQHPLDSSCHEPSGPCQATPQPAMPCHAMAGAATPACRSPRFLGSEAPVAEEYSTLASGSCSCRQDGLGGQGQGAHVRREGQGAGGNACAR